MTIPRQIRYNKKTDTGEQVRQRHEWYFFILNAPREIERLEEKIITQFAPSSNYSKLESGVIVPKGSLHGKLITFQSDWGLIRNKWGIYEGRFGEDRRLRSMNEDAFIKYLDQFAT
jgi:hypothetical protein